MMATAHARLMTAVDLTLTAPPEDPAAPIVHQVRGPDGEADMFEVRQDSDFYLQISRIHRVIGDIAEQYILFEAFFHTDRDVNIINLCGLEEYSGKLFIANALCSVTKSLFLLKKMDYYLSNLALDMSTASVTDGKWSDTVRLRVPSQAPYVCFPLQHRKLIWRSAGLDVNLWGII